MTPAPEGKPNQHAVPGAGWALAMLLAINLLNYIDRQMMAAVEPPVSSEFGLDEAKAGFLASAFLYAYMIGAPVLGRLAERFSRWWIIGGSIAIWSLASGWTGLAGSYSILILTRVLVGVGEAGYGPAAPALIADYYSVENRGKIMALFYLAIPVGSALGYVIGGAMNKHFGWRSAFYLSVVPGLILAALCFMRKDPRPAVVAVRERRSLLADARVLMRIPSYVINTAAMTAMTFAIGGIAFWIPKYMQQRLALDKGIMSVAVLERIGGAQSAATTKQLDELLADANYTFGIIVVVAGILSTFIGSWTAEKLRKRHAGAYFLSSGAAILFAFPCLLIMVSVPFPYAWYAVFGAVFFLFFNTGPANTALANVVNSKMRSTAFAVNIFCIHAFGDAISPPLVGYVKNATGSWKIAFTMVSLMMVVASVLWLIAARYLGRDTAAAEREG